MNRDDFMRLLKEKDAVIQAVIKEKDAVIKDLLAHNFACVAQCLQQCVCHSNGANSSLFL
jgi:hypothetical protein